MRQYKFARVFITLDAQNRKEAIKRLKKRYPNENIDLQLEVKKIVVAQSYVLPNEIDRNKPIQGFVYCKNCKKMHKDASKQQKRCEKLFKLKQLDRDMIDEY